MCFFFFFWGGGGGGGVARWGKYLEEIDILVSNKKNPKISLGRYCVLGGILVEGHSLKFLLCRL